MKLHLPVLMLIAVLWGCTPGLPRTASESERYARDLIDRGTLFLRQNDLEEAAAAYTISMELVPTAAALDGLGCVAFATGDLAAAEHLLLRSIELDATYGEAHRNLASVYERQGRFEAAQRLLLHALAIHPDDAQARNNLAARLYDDGFLERAQAQLFSASVLAEHPMIRLNLKRLDSRAKIHYSSRRIP